MSFVYLARFQCYGENSEFWTPARRVDILVIIMQLLFTFLNISMNNKLSYRRDSAVIIYIS